MSDYNIPDGAVLKLLGAPREYSQEALQRKKEALKRWRVDTKGPKRVYTGKVRKLLIDVGEIHTATSSIKKTAEESAAQIDQLTKYLIKGELPTSQDETPRQQKARRQQAVREHHCAITALNAQIALQDKEEAATKKVDKLAASAARHQEKLAKKAELQAAKQKIDEETDSSEESKRRKVGSDVAAGQQLG